MSSSRRVVASNHFSNLDFIMSLNKYIPSLVLQQLIVRDQSADKKSKLPELQPMETVVIFADISGFTNLSEACEKKGSRGNEELAFCINRYMEGMVSNLNQYGGDIIKFVGDAMIVMWPPINKDLHDWQETRNDTIRRAIQCSQDIQKHMNNLQILPGATLSVKIGIGYGECALLYVGGVFSRSESFTIGEALIQALRSEGNAAGGGQIIVAEPAYKYVKDFFRSKIIIDKEKGDEFFDIDYKHTMPRVKIQADAMKIRQQFSSELLAGIKEKMQGCVASSIIPYLNIDQEKYGSENRSVTVMFVSLGIELGSAGSPQGMNKIQQIVTEVQKQVYRQQGSVNKLLMDDKGSTLICLWGLLPFAHDDDAARAILAGFNMIKALNKIDNTYCNIGISSGECFSGVVGTSGSRKEFSVLGDIVNLAARIMGTVKGSKQKNEIRTDLNTRILASNQFDFKYTAHYELKGKSISLSFYKPLNPNVDKFELSRNKILSHDQFLNVHMNPLNLERNTEHSQKSRTIGFSEMMDSMVSDILDYYSSENSEQDCPQVFVVKGEPGSGKTAFAKNLIDRLYDASEFTLYLDANKGKLPVFASTVNAETQYHFLNIWRPIIQMLFTFFVKRNGNGLKKEQFLADVIVNSNNLDKLDIICELTGVDKHQMMNKKGTAFANQVREVEQIDPIIGLFPFVKQPDFTFDQKEELVDFLTQLIKCFIGEENDISGWHSILDPKQRSRHEIDETAEFEKPPFIIVMDNAHLMCPTSWKMIENVLEETYRLVIILLVQSDDMDRMRIHPDSVVAFEQVYNEIAVKFGVIEKELPRLNQDQLQDIIKDFAIKYKTSYKKEMEDMTKIIDPTNTLKTKKEGTEWQELLTNKWQIRYTISQIDPDILDVIVSKCKGNPLICLQYFINLLHTNFIEVTEQGFVKPNDKFFHCMSLNDWSTVPVPRLALKMNLQALDSYFYSVNAKGKNARPGELQNCTSSIVLLKAASVIGEEFELKALKFISPFPKSATSGKRVEDAIRLLERSDLIEIVDETDHKNAMCRFNKCFLRESIYQVLVYKSCKKDLHSETEKFIQQSQSLGHSKHDNSLVTEQLLQHMLLAQDTDDEANLLFERRSALVVLRVQNQINMNPRGLVLKENLYKQGDAVNKNVSHRLCTLTQFALKWYHDNEQEFLQDKFMGQVKLPFIFDVVKSKQARNERPSFMISVTMWVDRDGKEKGKRDLFFSCDTVQTRDKWMIAIDYLKTRAIYDAYAKKNTLVNFVNAAADEEHKGGDHEERDLSDLLYDFGDQLKNTTTQRQVSKLGSLSKQNSSLHALNRKSSIFQTGVTGLQSTMTAHDLLPKLKLLYKVGINSFWNHLDQKNFRTKAVIAKTATSKQGNQVEQMKFPHASLESWDVLGEINENLEVTQQESRFMGPSSHNSNGKNSNGRNSTSSLNGATNNYVSNKKSQNGSSEGQQRVPRKSRTNQSSIGENKFKNDKERRSSSISADHIKAINNKNVLPTHNSLIKEESERDSSNESDSENQRAFGNQKGKQGNGRRSEATSDQKKQLSMNYRNSEDSSSTPNTTPPLSGSILVSLANRTSSQNPSTNIPTVENLVDGAQREDNTSGFNQPLGLLDRENRQTFASHKGEDDYPIQLQDHESSSRENLQWHKQNPSSKQVVDQMGKQNSQQNSSQNSRAGHHRKAQQSQQNMPSAGNNVLNISGQSNNKNAGIFVQGASSSSQQVDSFRQNQSRQSQSFQPYQSSDKNFVAGMQQLGSNTNLSGQRPSIGKDIDKKEISMIQKQYGSRDYGDIASNSMLDPLQIQASQREKAHDDSSVNNSLVTSNISHSQESQNKKLISTIGTMITQQLNTGISNFFQEQKDTMDKMAEQQKQMHEQMARQQQNLLNASFNSAMVSQQQQTQQHPSGSLGGSFVSGQPQTPTQYQQLPQMLQQQQHQSPKRSPHPSQNHSNVLMQQPYSQHSQQQFVNQDFMTPNRAVNQNSSQPQFYHQQQQKPYGVHQNMQMMSSPHPQFSQSQNSLLNHTNQMSDFSAGGGVSKRSYKHQVDSGQPEISKQEMETHGDLIEDPVDPMLDASMDFQHSNLRQQQRNNLQQQPPLMNTPSYELDLREYYQKRQQPPQADLIMAQQQQQQSQQQNQRMMHPGDLRGQNNLNPLLTAKSFTVQSNRKDHPASNHLNVQLSDDNHTDHEATMYNRSQNQMMHPFSQQLSERSHLKTRAHSGQYQNMQQQQQQHLQQQMHAVPPQEIMDYTSNSAITVKPNYDQHSNSNGYPMGAQGVYPPKNAIKQQSNATNFDMMGMISNNQPRDQGHYSARSDIRPAARSEYDQAQQQIRYQHQQHKSAYQAQPIKFADKPLVFPPPENWTETQYAMYEEPLTQNQINGPNGTRAMMTKAQAIRDSVELRTKQSMIPRGTIVYVQEILEQASVCKVEHQGQLGLYKLQDFVNEKFNDVTTNITLSSHLQTGLSNSISEEKPRKNKKHPVKDSQGGIVHRQSTTNQAKSSSHHEVGENNSISISMPNDKSAGGVSRSVTQGASNVGNLSARKSRVDALHKSRTFQDNTFEQMSSIGGVDDAQDTSHQDHNNFFREDPEKNLSKQMKGLTKKELANFSKQFLEEDKAEHKQNNLKMVERQKRKAQAARKQALEKQQQKKSQ